MTAIPPISLKKNFLHDEEDPNDYAKGGYLNVVVGDQFDSAQTRATYTVIRKLGWGHFSTVWLTERDDGEYGALKVVKSAKHYGDAAKDEIALLLKVRRRAARCNPPHPGASHVCSLLDYFSSRGIGQDRHICMVFEPLGENLLSLLDKYRVRMRPDGVQEMSGVPMGAVRVIARQVLLGLQFLHEQCGLVHTDLKPENILITLPDNHDYIRAHLAAAPTQPPQRVKFAPSASSSPTPHAVSMWPSQPIPGEPIPLRPPRRANSASTERSTSSSRPRYHQRSSSHHQSHRYSPEEPLMPFRVQISDLGNATPVDAHFTEDIQTRQYRAPEAIIGRHDWGFPVDLWSVACIVFELLTGDFLFHPRSKKGAWEKDDDHMAQVIELCGDFPLELKQHGDFSRELFTSRGHLRRISRLRPWPLYRVLYDKYFYHERDAAALDAFLGPMLRVDPRERAGAGEMAMHPWVVDDGALGGGEWDEPVLRAVRARGQSSRRRPFE